MQTVLMYALAAVPTLLLLWVVMSEIIKHFRGQQAEIYSKALKGIAKAQGWLSFAEAVELLEGGGYDYSKGLHAAQMLGELPAGELSARAIRVLIDCLESSEPRMRSTAALSLGRIGDTSAIPALCSAMRSSPTPDEIERERAARFGEEFRQARARREGYSTAGMSVPSTEELHLEVRKAATWATQEIARRKSM